MGGVNARVDDESIDKVYGKWGVSRRNENGGGLAHDDSKYAWRKECAQNKQNGLIAYIIVDKRLKRDVIDIKNGQSCVIWIKSVSSANENENA